jgi:hypothetical protein
MLCAMSDRSRIGDADHYGVRERHGMDVMPSDSDATVGQRRAELRGFVRMARRAMPGLSAQRRSDLLDAAARAQEDLDEIDAQRRRPSLGPVNGVTPRRSVFEP